MSNIFLFIISLLIAFEASEEITECRRNSTKATKFRCRESFYGHSDIQTMHIFTINQKQPSYTLFHYVNNEKVLMVKLFKPALHKVQIETDVCKPSANAKDKTITCKDPNQYESKIQFICSYKDLICEEFSKQTHHCSIKAPANNTAVYWCKIKEKETQMKWSGLILRVPDVTTFTKSTTVGEKLTYYCKYNKDVNHSDLFICKGDDPTKCQFIVNITTAAEHQRFKMKTDEAKRNTTINMGHVKASDSGTYWCGAKSWKSKNQILIHRFFLNVVPTPTSPAVLEATSSSPASLPATTGARGALSLEVIPSVIIGAVGLLLILLAIVIFALYKRCVNSEKADRPAEQHPKEDYIYEEIPDVPQTKMSSVNATATFPTDDPASLHYSTMIFQTTQQAEGETLIMKPSSSSCQYSVLKYSQSSTSPTDPPTRSTPEPLYSVVQKPH